MKIEKEETVINTIYACDICSKSGNIHRCAFCGKDACYSHSVVFDFDCDLRRAYTHSDYPAHACILCWDKSEETRNKIQDIRDEAYNKEEVLWKQLKKGIKGD